MNWNLPLLKLSTKENQVLLWESFTDIHLTDFNCNYLNKLLENNIYKEQISIFLFGDLMLTS